VSPTEPIDDQTSAAEQAARTPEAPSGIDPVGVERWFAEQVPSATPPLRYELIAGGHSNLTYRVIDAEGARWVLRRPPLGHVLATAHDMGRESRIMAALAPTAVPVPPVVGLCADEDVNGAPFYVMEFVDGQVIRNSIEADALSHQERAGASRSLVDVLAAIHAVDLDEVGLADLGRHDGYIERQLKRWSGQWEKSKTRELPVVDEVHRLLSEHVPPQGPATIVHGDYRLDNCMLAPAGAPGRQPGEVIAVLDWEICTLGDPLADVGLLLVYWGDRATATAGVPGAPTLLEGFAEPAELLERYAAATGRDLSSVDYYVAFGYWKLACIIEGVYARYVGGAMGDHDKEAFAPFAQQVETLAELARDRIGAVT
jgi:aminoglycoside phosphotransferase (APT) family kinase protein